MTLAELTFAISLVVVAFDFQNMLAWWGGRTIKPEGEPTSDFTIIVPLFGHPRYFDRRAALLRYQRNVLVALETSAPGMAEFATELQHEGWRVVRLTIPSPNPATLVKAALPAVATTYVLRLDADTTIRGDLARGVAAAAAVAADLCSTKCAVANRVNVVTRLQAVEYRMAMLSRHFRPWLTSGACFVARTSALRTIFDHHSLWTPGEDIETGRTALALRMRIRHLDLVVETDAPDTWRGLFKQRQLWWAGTFRHWWINMDRNALHLPALTGYYVSMIWVSLYFKWWTLLDGSQMVRALPLVFLAYVFATVVSNLQVLSPWMLVFPLYSTIQVLVMPALGAVRYVSLARSRGSLGRYRFGYRRRRRFSGGPALSRG